MPKSQLLPSKQEIIPAQQQHLISQKSEIIVEYLNKMALPSMWNRELAEEDFRLWDELLGIYSIRAIRFGFDIWLTGGVKFPIPNDIIPLCISCQEQIEADSYQKPLIEQTRSSRIDGGHLQILTLWSMVNDRIREFEQHEKKYIPLSDREIEQMVKASKVGGYSPKYVNQSTHFENGNARYNRELTQAKALLEIKTPEWRA